MLKVDLDMLNAVKMIKLADILSVSPSSEQTLVKLCLSINTEAVVKTVPRQFYCSNCWFD